jgi:hypothetical protein
MRVDEYIRRKSELVDAHKKELIDLAKEYALANNPYKVGDLFTDHMGVIRVEKISVHFSSYGMPSCIYYGVIINKNGLYNKRGEKRNAYQTNDEKKKNNS